MTAKPAYLTVTGTLVFKNLEGGFFGFDADNGARYLPQGLDPKYRRHGYKLQIKGVVQKDVATFQQYGEVLVVKSVTVLAEPSQPAENEY